MLHYNRIDLSEGIDPVKRNTSEECIVITIFFFFFFFIHGFKFPNPVFFVKISRCCVLILAISMLLFKVLFIVIIHDINKSEGINLLENSVFDDCGYI